MAKLIQRDGKKEYDLAGDAFSIGRRSVNQIQVFEREVSRFHCRLEPSEGGWVLTDNGGKLGTLVNGQRVSQHRLQPGDVIRVGTAEFVFDDLAVPPRVRPLSEAEPGVLVPQEPKPPPRRLRLLPVTIGALVAVGIAGGLVAVLVSTRQTPERVARQAAELLRRRDSEGLWRLVSAERKHSLTFDEFQDAVKVLPSALFEALPSFKAGRARRAERGMIVPVALTVKGKPLTDEVVLYREDGDWRIYSAPVGRLKELEATGTKPQAASHTR